MSSILLATAVSLALGNPRRTVVISDLHMGLGLIRKGDAVTCSQTAGNNRPARCAKARGDCCWHPLEDFRWTEDFRAFLQAQDAAGHGQTDLVLNGDTFELWQSAAADCDHENNRNLGCTEAEALVRITRVLDEHRDDLRALHDFAAHKQNRVILVPGNHDAALAYTKVRNAVIRAIDAPHVTVKKSYWRSRDGLLFATHGQQIDPVNNFSTWPPFRKVNGTQYLDKPWGEQFVQRFFNQQELKYPVIDNIAGEVNGVRYGLAAQGLTTDIVDSGKFLRFFIFAVSGSQFSQTLAAPTAKNESLREQWDLDAIRKDGATFFAESLPSDDVARPALEIAAANGTLDKAFRTLTDRDIQAACDERAALHKANSRVERCPSKTMKAFTTEVIHNDDTELMRFLEQIQSNIVKADSLAPRFSVVVLSHTHIPRDAYDPNESRPKLPWHPRVLNTGAWQRIVSAENLRILREKRGWSAADVMSRLHLEDIAPCYPFVVIEPYKETPKPQLWYWKRYGQGWQARRDDCNTAVNL